MNVRQQIVDSAVIELSEALSIPPDLAFLRFVHSLIVGTSVHAFDLNDIVDGGQDKQIDIISIEERGSSADVFVIQGKNSESFSSNAIIQLGKNHSFYRLNNYLHLTSAPARRISKVDKLK